MYENVSDREVISYFDEYCWFRKLTTLEEVRKYNKHMVDRILTISTEEHLNYYFDPNYTEIAEIIEHGDMNQIIVFLEHLWGIDWCIKLYKELGAENYLKVYPFFLKQAHYGGHTNNRIKREINERIEENFSSIIKFIEYEKNQSLESDDSDDWQTDSDYGSDTDN